MATVSRVAVCSSSRGAAFAQASALTMSDISQRKADHLDLAVDGDVGFKQTSNLFECVRLVHDALPELDFDCIDLSTTLLGKTLRAPLLIAGMTGGTERATRINRALAEVAEQRGYAFGLGSQRPLLSDPTLAGSYRIRDTAPTALVLGNIGAVQAVQRSDGELLGLVHSVGADGLCVHLNPAMELVQRGGDRDFRGCLARLAQLAEAFPVPVVVKETGCGLSAQVALRLRGCGIRHVDVSGAGGTSWVALEALRCSPEQRVTGSSFSEWGIPTAASVALVAGHGFETVFATGGITTGLEIAKAIVLGASAGGIARPVLQALETKGPSAVHELFDRIEAELRMTMLLVGAADLSALARAPRLVVGELAEWLRQSRVVGDVDQPR
jgi:isopentenyl-diphosphate delta-isomerase